MVEVWPSPPDPVSAYRQRRTSPAPTHYKNGIGRAANAMVELTLVGGLSGRRSPVLSRRLASVAMRLLARFYSLQRSSRHRLLKARPSGHSRSGIGPAALTRVTGALRIARRV